MGGGRTKFKLKEHIKWRNRNLDKDNRSYLKRSVLSRACIRSADFESEVRGEIIMKAAQNLRRYSRTRLNRTLSSLVSCWNSPLLMLFLLTAVILPPCHSLWQFRKEVINRLDHFVLSACSKCVKRKTQIQTVAHKSKKREHSKSFKLKPNLNSWSPNPATLFHVPLVQYLEIHCDQIIS